MAGNNSIYQPTLQPSGSMVQPNNRGVRASSMFAESAKLLSAGLDNVVDYATEKLDDDSKAWAANASSQADIAAQEMYENKRRAAPDGAPMFQEDLMKDWKKYQDDTLKNSPNERASELMNSHFNSVTESLTIKSKQFQNEEKDRWRTKMAGDGVDADARLLSTQTAAEIDQSVEKSLGKWTTYYKSLDMEPADRQKLIDATREKVTNAANMRKIELDPKGYLVQNAAARKTDALQGDPSAPRGIRNNNPGNLRTDKFTGNVGVDKDGYGKFDSPESGLRAMAKNLIVQQDKHGLNTVEDIISKYAPPSENNTAAYIQKVSTALGVQPTQQINVKDPDTLQKMMGAMITQENGTQPYSPLQIKHGIDAAINGTSVGPLNAKKPEEGGHVITGSTAYSLGTWEQQQKWISLAETEDRRVTAERKAKVTEANTLMASAKERMQTGFALPDSEMQSITAAVVDTGDAVAAKKWQDLQATQAITKSMQQLSPAELSNVINTQLEPMAHREGATEREAMQLDIGQKLLNTMSEKVKSDPLSWAAQTGMAVTPLDFNKPESLPQRVATAQAVSQKYGIPVENAIFSQAEKEQFTSSLGGMTDTMKLALGKRMQEGFGPYFSKAVGEIAAKDPIFAQASFLSSLSPANDGLALDILRGQRTLKELPDQRPKEVDKQGSLANLGTAFQYMPQAAPGVIASADALYVQRVGMVDEFNPEAYDTALNDVLGKTKDGRGGIASLNGKDYLLPQQFTEDDFERGIAAMTADELAAMSIGGGPPIYGKKKNAVSGAELVGNVTLRSIAYGQYAAFDENDNKVTSEKGPNGQFILAIDPAKFQAILNKANETKARQDAGRAAAIPMGAF